MFTNALIVSIPDLCTLTNFKKNFFFREMFIIADLVTLKELFVMLKFALSA